MKYTKPNNEEWMRAVDEASKLPDDFNRKNTKELRDKILKINPPTEKIGSFAELIDTFPKAAPAARRAARSRIKDLTYEISSLSDFRELWTNDIQKIPDIKKRWAYQEYVEDLIERLRKGYEVELRKYLYQIEYLNNLKAPREEQKINNSVTPEQIARARMFPIEDLIPVKKGNALCLWHEDHKPSMKIYKDNHAYCFSCCQSADSIDIQMQLTGCDFKTAVRRLAP